MQIITATESHIPFIQEIAKATWPHTFKNILSLAQMEYMLNLMYNTQALTQQINELQHVFLLSKENNAYCGYSSYELNYKQQPNTKIHKLYILPTNQGKGVGGCLIKTIEEAAVIANNSSITLNVNRDNKAVLFYTKMGYHITGTADIDIGNGFLMEDAIMVKKL